jgi:hypothetical protein
MLKSTEPGGGILSLQNPHLMPGKCGNVINYEVTDVPDDVTDAEVLHLAQGSIWVAGYSARYEQLGAGRIIR